MINVVGTFSVTKSFVPLLKKGHKKTIINISSNAASLSRNASYIHQPGVSDASLALSYRVAKVGVNMGMFPSNIQFCTAFPHSTAPCCHCTLLPTPPFATGDASLLQHVNACS